MCARRETGLPACTHKLRHHRSVHMQQAHLPSHTHTLMCPELHAHTQVVLQPAPLPLSSGPQTTMTHSEAKVITCFTCSDSRHCGSLPCLADRNSCLQMAGIMGERPWGQDWVGEAETGPEAHQNLSSPSWSAALTPVPSAFPWPWRTELGGSEACKHKICCHLCYSYLLLTYKSAQDVVA